MTDDGRMTTLIEENKQLREVLGDLLKMCRWWASQEDGIPEEVAPDYCKGMLVLNWEFGCDIDMNALAATMKCATP